TPRNGRSCLAPPGRLGQRQLLRDRIAPSPDPSSDFRARLALEPGREPGHGYGGDRVTIDAHDLRADARGLDRRLLVIHRIPPGPCDLDVLVEVGPPNDRPGGEGGVRLGAEE